MLCKITSLILISKLLLIISKKFFETGASIKYAKAVIEFLHKRINLLKACKEEDLVRMKNLISSFEERKYIMFKHRYRSLRDYLYPIRGYLPMKRFLPPEGCISSPDKKEVEASIEEYYISIDNYHKSYLKVTSVLTQGAYYDLLTKDFFDLIEYTPIWGLQYELNYPLFFYAVLKGDVPSLDGVNEDVLKRVESFLVYLIRSTDLLIRTGHYTLAGDIFKYCRKLITKLVIAHVKKKEGELIPGTNDFIFYFINFNKHIKKYALRKYGLISENDRLGFKSYTRICNKIYHELKLCIEYSRSVSNSPATSSLSELFKDLYGIPLCFNGKKKNFIMELLSSEKLMINILNQEVLMPYFVYKLFHDEKNYKRNYKRRKAWIKPMLGYLIDNKKFSILVLLFNKVPLAKLSILHKVTQKYPNEASVLDVWNAYMKTMSKALTNKKAVTAMLTLYNIRNKNELFKLKADNNKNPLLYTLIHQKYGYVLTTLFKFMEPNKALSFAQEYNLPIDILTITFSYVSKNEYDNINSTIEKPSSNNLEEGNNEEYNNEENNNEENNNKEDNNEEENNKEEDNKREDSDEEDSDEEDNDEKEDGDDEEEDNKDKKIDIIIRDTKRDFHDDNIIFFCYGQKYCTAYSPPLLELIKAGHNINFEEQFQALSKSLPHCSASYFSLIH